MATVHAPVAGIGWIDWAGAVGAILFAVGLLVSFFTSSDYGETAESLIACAEDADLELWWSQILALLMPILIGHAVLAPCRRMTAPPSAGCSPVSPGTWRRTSWPGRAGPSGSRTTSGTAMRA